jgi:hypothetical protein
MKRYKIYDGNGVRSDVFDLYPTIATAGDYEIRHTKGSSMWPFAIVCPPKQCRPGRWNVSELTVDNNGTIEWRDEDVQLDPYHMCLLYQALENINQGEHQ